MQFLYNLRISYRKILVYIFISFFYNFIFKKPIKIISYTIFFVFVFCYHTINIENNMRANMNKALYNITLRSG